MDFKVLRKLPLKNPLGIKENVMIVLTRCLSLECSHFLYDRNVGTTCVPVIGLRIGSFQVLDYNMNSSRWSLYF